MKAMDWGWNRAPISRERQGHVADGLGQGAAQAEQDHRSELGIAEQTGHQFTLAGDLGLEQQPFKGRSGRFGDLCGRRSHGHCIVKMQAHQAHLCLVLQRFPQPLEHHRVAETIGGGNGLVSMVDGHLFDHRDVESAQELFGLMLVQRAGGQGSGGDMGVHRKSLSRVDLNWNIEIQNQKQVQNRMIQWQQPGRCLSINWLGMKREWEADGDSNPKE